MIHNTPKKEAAPDLAEDRRVTVDFHAWWAPTAQTGAEPCTMKVYLTPVRGDGDPVFAGSAAMAVTPDGQLRITWRAFAWPVEVLRDLITESLRSDPGLLLFVKNRHG